MFFDLDGPQSWVNRSWADKIRPFDAELADLYVRLAEANEAIRAHIARRTG